MPSSNRFNLTVEQQRLWQQLVGSRPRGTQTEIARALSSNRNIGGKIAAWKTQLSLFFQGGEKGLQAIFDHQNRLRVVAKALDAVPGDLERWLDTAKGIPTRDAPGEIRVPGFEDFGPIPVEEVFFPPALQEMRVLLGGYGESATSTNQFDLGKLIHLAQLRTDGLSKAIVIVGGPGAGKSPTLAALVAALRDEGEDVDHQGDGTEDADIVACDDLDALDHKARSALILRVKENTSTLLCTVHPGASLADLPPDRVYVVLGRGGYQWTREYLQHFEALGSKILHRDINTEPLQRWIEDSPEAVAYLDRADLLGLLVRHVVDGGEVPVSPTQILSLAVERWGHLLRQQGKAEVAIVVETCLIPAMAKIAAEACRGGIWEWPLKGLAGALVNEAGAGLAGKVEGVWGALGAPGMLAVVESLTELGVLIRKGNQVQPCLPVFQVASLGHALHEHLQDGALLQNLILDVRWHEALVVAVELQRDSASVLRALEDLSPALRAHSYPAATRVLSAGASCSDEALLNRWFLRCLWWWAAVPPDSRATTMMLGHDAPKQQRPPEALVGQSAPLFVLARASLQHRDRLQTSLSIESVKQAEMTGVEQGFITMRGFEASDDRMADALLVGAPFQTDLLMSSEHWQRFPSMLVRGHDLPGGLTRTEYTTWWRTVAVPRLHLAREVQCRLAGTFPGWSITWGMTQPEGGVEIWRDALLRRLQQGDVRAPVAFAEAVEYLICAAGRINLRALQLVWEKIPLREREAFRDAVQEALPEPGRWFDDKEIIGWILKAILLQDQLVEIWKRWIAAPETTLRRIPWLCFIDGGLPFKAVLDWAIDTLPEDYRAGGQVIEALNQSATGMAFALHDPEDAPQASALDHLVSLDEPQILEACLYAPQEWSQAAWGRLSEIAPERAREIRLARAADLRGRTRFQMLSGITPRQGEADRWLQFARTSETWGERLEGWVRVAIAQEGEGRWQPAWDTLHILEMPSLNREAAKARLSQLQSAPPRLVEVDSESETSASGDWTRALVDTVAKKWIDILASIGGVLWATKEWTDEGLGALVTAAFDGPLLKGLSAQNMGYWWRLAWECLGQEFVTRKLVDEYDGRPLDQIMTARLQACFQGGLFDLFIRPLVHHPVAGRIATRIVAERIGPQFVTEIREALQGQPVCVDDGSADLSTIALVKKFAIQAPQEAVEWTVQALEGHELALRVTWWEALLPSLPHGACRVIGLQAWEEAFS